MTPIRVTPLASHRRGIFTALQQRVTTDLTDSSDVGALAVAGRGASAAA